MDLSTPARLGRVGIEICYASVYDEVWRLTSLALEAPCAAVHCARSLRAIPLGRQYMRFL